MILHSFIETFLGFLIFCVPIKKKNKKKKKQKRQQQQQKSKH